MNTECGICFEFLQPSDALSSTPCGHVFHQQCLMEWLGRSQTCPQCRCYVSAATIRAIYLNFSSNDLAPKRNLESGNPILEQLLDIKEQEIAAREWWIKKMRAELESRNRKLKLKTAEAENLLEWLQVREKEIRRLEDNAKIDYKQYKMQIEIQRKQQDILIEKLTASRRESETFKRQLELELEKRDNEIEMQRQRNKLIEYAADKERIHFQNDAALHCSLIVTANKQVALRHPRYLPSPW